MTETKNSKMLDEGGKSVVALMAALMAAIFAFQLNASMLSPALTTMRVELNTTDAQIGLTQTVFFTSCAVFSLFLPRLGDLIGRKKVLLGILVLTALGCVVSALAVNVPMLMIGRVIQGVAGPIVPMTLIMLHAKVTEDKKYAKLMAILTSVNGGIGGVDAILGGWLAGTFGFRSVFWVMVGVAVLAIVLVFVYAEESTASETPKMDWAGVVSLAAAFLAAYLAINEIQKLGSANWAMVAVEIVIAAVLFVVFWNVEKRQKAPMVTTHYLKQRRTWGLLLTTLLTMTGVFAIMNGYRACSRSGYRSRRRHERQRGIVRHPDSVCVDRSRIRSGRRRARFEVRLPCGAAYWLDRLCCGRAVRHLRVQRSEHLGTCGHVFGFGCFLRRYCQHHAERSGHRALSGRQSGLSAWSELRCIQPGCRSELCSAVRCSERVHRIRRCDQRLHRSHGWRCGSARPRVLRIPARSEAGRAEVINISLLVLCD